MRITAHITVFSALARGVVLCALMGVPSTAGGQEPEGERARFNVTVTAEKLSLEELGRLVPAVKEIELPPGFEVTRLQTSGSLERLRIEFRIASDRSALEGEVVADVTAPDRAVEGTASLRSVNLARLLDRPSLPTQITGSTRFDLTFTAGDVTAIRGTYSISAEQVTVAGYTASAVEASGRLLGREATFDAEARAYGAPVSAEGTVRFPPGDAGVRYELEGAARDVNLARLPQRLELPRLTTNLDLSYKLENPDGSLEGRATLRRSTVEGATLAAGTQVNFSLAGDSPAYFATGTVYSLNPRRMGRALEVEALQEPLYEGQLNARFEVLGEGAQIDRAIAEVFDSEALGGRLPEMNVRLSLGPEEVEFSAEGRFRDIEPSAALPERQLRGDLSGSLEVEGRLARGGDFDLGDLTVEGRLDLDEGSLAGVELRDGVIAASLAGGSLRLRQLTVSGPGTSLRVSGVAALAGEGISFLDYFVQTPALGPLAERFGVPLTGDVRVRGTLTGNVMDEIQTTGTLAGTYVGYGDSGAATLTAGYEAAIPLSALSRTRAAVTLDAELVTAAGLVMDHLGLQAELAERRIAFELQASREGQEIDTAALLAWHPDHQELHVRRFVFASDEVRWSLPAASSAALVYAGDTLRITGLHLTGGPDQEIFVEGSLGAGDAEPLVVRVANVDLGDFDGFFSEEQALAGRLDLRARVAGALDSPRVSATWSLLGGSFRDFRFESFRGEATYDGMVARVESRLDQGGIGSLTINGTAPVGALLAEGEVAAANAAWDLRIRSVPLGLGFVSALTDAVANVEGVTEIDLALNGPPRDPRIRGDLFIRDGSFLVVPTGAAYRAVNATVRFDGDVAHVDALTAVDDDGDIVTVRGRLPLDAGVTGPLEVHVVANNFEILDDDIGQLEVEADLSIDGTLTSPRVRGEVRLTDGEIRVDEVLLFGDEAYALEAGADPDLAELRPDAPVGLLRDLPVALDVRLLIPDNLLMRGTDLRTSADMPIGVGDVNVTVGGDVRLEKAPDAPLLVRGEIQTVRGTYEFQGREFEVLRRGTIRFAGEPEINPTLELTARRIISRVEARVQIGGTLRSPTLALSSQPPLDEAEIFSLIVFNAPTLQLGASEQVSLSQRASSLVTGFIGSKIAETVGTALDLDLLDIETGQQISGFGPTVTIGEQFGGLYVKLRQTFGPETVSEVVLEYQLTEWARLESSFSEAQGLRRQVFRRVERGGIDAVIFFTY